MNKEGFYNFFYESRDEELVRSFDFSHSSLGYIHGELMDIQKLKRIGELHIPEKFTGEISLPNLEVCDVIVANKCTILHAPKLRTARQISCSGAESINLPSLIHCDDLFLGHALNIVLDSLAVAAKIINYRSKKCVIPKLKQVELIVLHGEIIELPSITNLFGSSYTSHSDFKNAKSIDLSNLESSMDSLSLPKVEGYLDLGKFKNCRGSIYCPSASKINLKSLEKSGSIMAKNAKEIIINPNLDTSKDPNFGTSILDVPSSCYINTSGLASKKVGRVLSKL